MQTCMSQNTVNCNSVTVELPINMKFIHFQHGFQSGLSCESQLIETVHDWMTALDNKHRLMQSSSTLLKLLIKFRTNDFYLN